MCIRDSFAMERSSTGEMTRSLSGITYQLGLVFHAAAVTVASNAAPTIGICESAMNCAVLASTSAQNPAGNLALSKNTKPSAEGTAGSCGASAGAFLRIAPTGSPASGANAATYTRRSTFGSLPASVITTPPHECATSTTGPSIEAMTRFVAATSSANDCLLYTSDAADERS